MLKTPGSARRDGQSGVLRKPKWLAFELQIVVAERTVEVTSISELEQR